MELLKNALRATVETHRGGEGNAMPKVQVMIASGEQDVTFKIVDEGGGIKRSELKQVWTYLHSSAARPPIAEDLKKDNRHNRQSCALAGYGIYSRPLVFRQSLHVMSCVCRHGIALESSIRAILWREFSDSINGRVRH